MKLTRIPVRGKNKRTRPAADDASSTSATPSMKRPRPSHLAASSSPQSPFPQNPPLALSTASRPQGDAARPPSRRARAPRPPPFDRRFPLEIIERIFLLSQNLNLPRASPRLGWMLSSRRTLVETALAAFGPAWDKLRTDPGAIHSDHMPNLAGFQTAVLATHWAKADLLLEAQRLWSPPDQGSRFLHVLPAPNELSPTVAEYLRNPSQARAILAAHAATSTGKCPLGHRPPPNESRSGSPGFPGTVQCCFSAQQLAFVSGMDEQIRLLAGDGPWRDANPIVLLAFYVSPTPWSGLAMEHVQTRLVVPTRRLSSHLKDLADNARALGFAYMPEWLLLGGGPYAPATTPAGHAAVRAQLQAAFDTFFWLLLHGMQLHYLDSWEVTRQGFRNLLAVDAGPHADDTDAGDGDNAAAGPARPLLTTDALVAGMLALFAVLGVFQKQWPLRILEEELLRATRRAEADPVWRRSKVYALITTVAVECARRAVPCTSWPFSHEAQSCIDEWRRRQKENAEAAD